MNKRLIQFLTAIENRIERLNDKGHDKRHLYNVIYYALELNKELDNPIDEEILLTTVYLHDLFCYLDRANHHNLAADFTLNSTFINKYFDKSIIVMMAEAIREHRSSIKDRNSTLSKILYDADKLDSLLDIDRMIERSILYNIKNFPNDSNLHSSVYNHLKKKYGSNYINLYFSNKNIESKYDRVKYILHNPNEFDRYYNKVYEEIV